MTDVPDYKNLQVICHHDWGMTSGNNYSSYRTCTRCRHLWFPVGDKYILEPRVIIGKIEIDQSSTAK